MCADSRFKPSFFEREDDTPDALFYGSPRLLVHIDDGAIAAARALYADLLPASGVVLDLMSSYRSHLPPELRLSRVAGLGMNEVEMRENDQLSEYVVHDLNRDPRLPYGDSEFDGVVITVSVQYLTQPVEVFRDVGRVLKDGAPLIVTYSNRMFPTKAVRIWRALDDRERGVLVRAYFHEAGGFGAVTIEDRGASGADPLFAVWGRRAADDDSVAGQQDQV